MLFFYRKRAMKKSIVSFLICLLPFAAFAQTAGAGGGAAGGGAAGGTAAGGAAAGGAVAAGPLAAIGGLVGGTTGLIAIGVVATVAVVSSGASTDNTTVTTK